MTPSRAPPLFPQESWLGDGRQVLHFCPTRWNRHTQVLEVTSGELLPGAVLGVHGEVSLSALAAAIGSLLSGSEHPGCSCARALSTVFHVHGQVTRSLDQGEIFPVNRPLDTRPQISPPGSAKAVLNALNCRRLDLRHVFLDSTAWHNYSKSRKS